MKLSIANFYQAHSSNFTKGRQRPIRFITVHHTAANNDTLRHLWQNPARNGSSHFFVSDNKIEQYVDTNDTAWTNSNWDSNNESITIETNGDWRNGYYNQKTLDNLQRLIVELRKHYPQVGLTFHTDVADKSRPTVCPADLKNKGYAKKVWDNATAILNPPKPEPAKPTPSKITYKPITPKRVILNKASNLWNFNFTDWSKAQAVASYQKGHTVDVVAEATNQLGGKYYMTAYSYNNGNVRATNGFNVKDADDFKEPTPPPVTPPPVIEPVKPPTTPPPITTPTTPIDTNPNVPSDSDVVKRLNALEKAVQAIVDFLSSIFTNYKKG